MAWPPPVLPINRTNATPQLDTHAADHNAVNLAVNDIVTRLTGQGLPELWDQAGGAALSLTAGQVGNVFINGTIPAVNYRRLLTVRWCQGMTGASGATTGKMMLRESVGNATVAQWVASSPSGVAYGICEYSTYLAVGANGSYYCSIEATGGPITTYVDYNNRFQIVAVPA